MIRVQTIMSKSELEIYFADLLDGLGWTYEREYQFHPTRKWRFDFIIHKPPPVDLKQTYIPTVIGVEIEGGVWTRGRHTRGAGFIKDCEKYNHAAAMGWRVFRFTKETIMPTEYGKDPEAIRFLKEEVFQLGAGTIEGRD